MTTYFDAPATCPAVFHPSTFRKKSDMPRRRDRATGVLKIVRCIMFFPGIQMYVSITRHNHRERGLFLIYQSTYFGDQFFHGLFIKAVDKLNVSCLPVKALYLIR